MRVLCVVWVPGPRTAGAAAAQPGGAGLGPPGSALCLPASDSARDGRAQQWKSMGASWCKEMIKAAFCPK